MITWKTSALWSCLCLTPLSLLFSQDQLPPVAAVPPSASANPAEVQPPGPSELFLIEPSGKRYPLFSVLQNLSDRDGHRSDELSSPHRFCLGVRLTSLTDQQRTTYQLPPTQGLLVLEVVKDSPAEYAGVKTGDVLLSVDQKDVAKSSDVIGIVNSDPKAAHAVTLLRQTETLNFSITPMEIPESLESANPRSLSPAAMRKLKELGFAPGSMTALGPGVVVNSTVLEIDDLLQLKLKVRSLESQVEHLEARLQELTKQLEAVSAQINTPDQVK